MNNVHIISDRNDKAIKIFRRSTATAMSMSLAISQSLGFSVRYPSNIMVKMIQAAGSLSQ